MTKKRVFLVDDHPLVREWLTNLINQQADLTVCGEAEDAAQALPGIGSSQADVAVVDISLRGSSGVELIKDLRILHPHVSVIVLSMHDESLYAERVLRAGARGYVMKREATKNIAAAIRQVLEGKLYVSDRVAHLMAEKFAEGPPTDAPLPVSLLSDRELEVFQLLGQGQETKKIAETLHVSIKTIQAYCARIKEKLKLHNVNELLREAIRWDESRHHP